MFSVSSIAGTSAGSSNAESRGICEPLSLTHVVSQSSASVSVLSASSSTCIGRWPFAPAYPICCIGASKAHAPSSKVVNTARCSMAVVSQRWWLLEWCWYL